MKFLQNTKSQKYDAKFLQNILVNSYGTFDKLHEIENIEM